MEAIIFPIQSDCLLFEGVWSFHKYTYTPPRHHHTQSHPPPVLLSITRKQHSKHGQHAILAESGRARSCACLDIWNKFSPAERANDCSESKLLVGVVAFTLVPLLLRCGSPSFVSEKAGKFWKNLNWVYCDSVQNEKITFGEVFDKY